MMTQLKAAINLLGSAIHVILPAVVVGCALWFHFVGNPLAVSVLIVLVSAAYGKTIWHDFLQAKTLTGTFTDNHATTTNTTTTTTKTLTGTIAERDPERGIQVAP